MPPAVNLKTTVIPRSIMRATVLGDVMKNFGASDNDIRIAQEGFANGHIFGLTVKGRDHANWVRDEVHLHFDQLASDDNVQVEVSGGRSMIEAVSLKFAHAVAYSVNLMHRKGLRISVHYHFHPHTWTDPAHYQRLLARYGLVPGNDGQDYEPGTAMRQLLAVRPGFDNGITYSHATSQRIR